MRIALLGTRGAPARYGGFETAVEEIGWRLADRGHHVVVYCRGGDETCHNYRGMELVHLPTLKHKVAETLSHTALSVMHLMRRRGDAAVLFNAANAMFLPAFRVARVPVALHVDGLEWKRAKWGAVGRRYYLASERIGVWLADALIADAQGIQAYYRQRYGVDSFCIPYGAPILERNDGYRVRELGVEPGGYHLVVARFEPENNLDLIIRGYVQSNARRPLILVGGAPYADAYTATLHALADGRVRFAGPVWDQQLLDALYSNAASYWHGHSVGGTNPSLLRAMGAGAPICAVDVVFNREVLADTGKFFSTPDDVAQSLAEIEADGAAWQHMGARSRDRAALEYRWDDVALRYEDMLIDIVSGTRHGR